MSRPSRIWLRLTSVTLAPAFERITTDEAVRQLLEALDARHLATPDSLGLLGQLHISSPVRRRARGARARVGRLT